MKKALPIILVLAAVIAGAFVYFRNKPDTGPGGVSRAAELAPGLTTVFLAAPDVARSLKRWDETAISQIAAEPEWKEFAGKIDEFLFSMVPDKEFAESFRLLKEAEPAEFFLAVVQPAAPKVEFAGGLAYRGKMTSVKSAIEKWQKFLLSGVAAPKSEIVKDEDTEIELLTSSGKPIVAFAYRDNWFLFAGDVEQMKELLQRYKGSGQPKVAGAPVSLAKNGVYAESVKQVLPDGDLVGFINTREIMGKVRELRSPDAEPKKEDPWDAYIPDSLIYSLKMEGRLMRSRSYVRMPKMPKAQPMTNRLAAFTNSDTYVYGSLNVAGLDDLLRLILAEEEKAGGFKDDLQTKGLRPLDLMTIFGPELSVHSDWEPVAVWPNVMGVLEVRDAAKARLFAELLAEKIGSSGQLSKKEEDGVTYWTVALGAVVAQPTVAISDKHMVIAINYATAVGGFKQLKSGAGSLAKSPEFQNALKATLAPTAGTLYLDTKKLFERLYEKLKPMAAMQLAGNPQMSKYVDPGKFPKTETISKHLTPMTVVYADAPDGFVIEANGPAPLETVVLPGTFFAVPMRARAVPPARAPVTPAPAPAPPATPPAPR
jgi:hypothetical protein